MTKSLKDYTILFMLLTIGLASIDGGLTLIGIEQGFYKEYNPIMILAIEQVGLYEAFFIRKLFLTIGFLIISLTWIYEKYYLEKYVYIITTLFIVYTILNVYHLINYLRFFII